MIRRYGAQDIERWAQFSGDRNRVHFDKAFAIKNGLKDIIVQGMLVLLDAKLLLADSLDQTAMLNFYIKKPVPIDRDVELSMTCAGGKRSVAVKAGDDPQNIAITAAVLPQKPPDPPLDAQPVAVSEQTIQAHLEQLKFYYPHVTTPWVMLDTLLFSICFNHQKEGYFINQAEKIASHHSLENITTYHVANKVFISERLISGGRLNYSELRYLIEDKDIYIDKDSAYNTFTINVLENDEITFQSSIDCLTRVYDRTQDS
ncbi:MaoC/PaaZ C-terminal domain-containing protein [Kosakonia cowanii]|uniref:MaoC/PaaZ C-terminal domain-containing protein n=1 Tax=Kosakonia cowanii TaxID=208223 RepID=UPI0023F6ED8F|nr:MaoC/PaaZ C-terminal domain-containing protein [Kosakonia cowanii]MDF7761995.1 MaoC/PaaZ C-terminal domain-containing protein [Kosakonia cowanii]